MTTDCVTKLRSLYVLKSEEFDESLITLDFANRHAISDITNIEYLLLAIMELNTFKPRLHALHNTVYMYGPISTQR